MLNSRLQRACPCRICEERKVTADYNCHDHCDSYKGWQNACEAEHNAYKADLPPVIHHKYLHVGAADAQEKKRAYWNKQDEKKKKRESANSIEKGVHKIG